MFQRFTERANRVMELAQAEAQKLHHDAIETEHILLGLIQEERGGALRILRTFGLEADQVRREVERRSPGRSSSRVQGPLSLSSRATKAVRLSHLSLPSTILSVIS